MTQYASMDELLAKTGKTLKVLKYGDVVEGRVVSIARNQVLVDLKAKSEGMVSARELTENPALYKNLKVGDTVLASVLQPENDRGYVVLSLKKAASEYRWRELSDIFEQGSTLTVRVTEFNKGGFLVDAGIPGFIPLTHLDKARMNDSAGPEKLIGQAIDVKIIEMDRGFLDRSVNDGFSGGEKKRNEILQMAVLEPTLAILDETDSGLDIDALRIVASGVNKLLRPDNAVILVTHYQRLLDYITPDYVHVMQAGRIIKTGDKSLALELESRGYDWVRAEGRAAATA